MITSYTRRKITLHFNTTTVYKQFVRIKDDNDDNNCGWNTREEEKNDFQNLIDNNSPQ